MQSKAAVRRVATTLAAFTLLFVMALSVEAKMPEFETDVEVDGTTATVTVTFDMEGFDPPELERVVAIYPSSAIDDSGEPVDDSSRVDVLLTREIDGVYQGEVDLEETGSWAAVSMPDMYVDPVFEEHVVTYADTVYFETRNGTAWGWVAGGAAATLALGVLVWRPRSLWKPLLATAGVIGLVLVTTAAVPGDADATFECPVTIPPQPGFSPPEPWPAPYPHEGSVWYGNPGLWTVLERDGDYGPRKSVWWSANFPGGAEEERPDLHVTWTRLDTEDQVVIDNEGRATNAHTEAEGWFMIGGIDPDLTDEDLNESGCWRVSAEYKGATLSYVYQRS